MLFYIQPSPKQGTTLDWERDTEREREKGRKSQTEKQRETDWQTEVGTEGAKQTCIKRNKMENIEPGNIVATVNIDGLKQTNSDP